MKFRCERDLLADALTAAGRAATNRGGALPVLSGVRLALTGSRLEVTGTDVQLWITVSVDVDGSEDGETVVPARIAQEVVRSLQSGAVSCAVTDGEFEITSGRFRSQIRTLPADEFPALPEMAESSVTLDAGVLADALHQVVPAASSDDARPILTGVLFAAEGDGLRLVATDSYRLAVRDVVGAGVLGESQQVLVPSRALREVERLLSPTAELTVRLSERDASFEVVVDGVTTRLETRLIEGDFPNYRQLIPSEYPNELTVSRELLADAVRRVRLMAREGTPVRLSMSANGLELVAVTQDVGQASEVIDATYRGEDLTVAFNPEYLLDGVEIATGDEVTLSTLDALKPAVLRASDSASFLYLLMPVRVA